MFDGKAFGENLVEIVKAYVDEAYAPLLRETEGLRDQVRGLKEQVRGLAARSPEKGVDGRDGRDGADADMDALRAHCEALIAALPKPENGKDGRAGADGQDGPRGEPGSSGRDGKDGADGVGLAGAIIDRDGVLNLTLSNGEVKALGRVEGRDGRDGERGEAGFGLDDFDARLMSDGRTVELSFKRGDVAIVRGLALPTMIYRGVYTDGRAYEKGDTVTWAGSLWHCEGAAGEPMAGTTEKPGEGSKAWTLAAKRGRDGKDFAGPVERAPKTVRV